MSEYTREEILRLIEENGGPEGLDLSGKDLSWINLGREAIEAELEKVRERAPDEIPVWYSERTEGMNLEGANLQEANLARAKLYGANLSSAKLQGADLHHVTYNNSTRWPTGFVPPPEALNMEVLGAPRKAKGYSLWLMPSGDVYNALAGLISQLSREYLTPNFEPHVTLIGSLDESEEDILSKTSELATLIHPFNIRLTKVDYLDKYFRCLFITVERTNDTMKANWKAREIFGLLQDRQYMPHLSLMYGCVPTALKEEIVAEIGEEFDMSFQVRSIHLFSTDGEPKDWYRVEEFTLG